MPYGIPSHDTFERVFARLDPEAFEHCFVAWTQALSVSSGGQLVAIDGKRIRRSVTHAWEQSTAIHLVSAFIAGNAMVFAQLAVDAERNEIVAIPKLPALLDLQGAIVTIDAIGCQTALAEQIVKQRGDYVLAVKDNQPTLARRLRADLDDLVREEFKNAPHDVHETIDGDHGRIVNRSAPTTGASGNWPNISSNFTRPRADPPKLGLINPSLHPLPRVSSGPSEVQRFSRLPMPPAAHQIATPGWNRPNRSGSELTDRWLARISHRGDRKRPPSRA